VATKCISVFHNWNGCKCSKCGRIRDEQHSWDGCKCKECGAGSPSEDMHDWEYIKSESGDSESDEWYGGHFVTLTTTCTNMYYRCRRCKVEKVDWETTSGMGGTRGSRIL